MHENFVFADLRELFAKANEEKSGDQLAGIAARSERERVAAKRRLSDLSLDEILRQPLIDPGDDDVSRLIMDTYDANSFETIRSMTVGAFREYILDDATAEAQLKQIQRAIVPEIAAAVAKIMSNKDLILAAAKIRNVTHCRNTMGERGVLGIRIQPNHPVDDLGGILLATFEGLLYGCGDAVIGVNPASDSIETVSSILRALERLVDAYHIPTQSCCLAHLTTQLAALERGAPLDLLFQSVAGTEGANQSFGITLAMLAEGRERVLEDHRRRDVPWKGEDVMYFETGQGSALSAEAHHGVDQLTLEARAYGVARAFDPFLVNSVVGFIGPEYLYDERQIVRAGLEDHFMGKLLGLPMGCDVCYTNHAAADQNSADNLLILLAAAGCNYFMGVPCSDDVMLNYQSTSYHDALAVRRMFNLRPAPEFLEWLRQKGFYRDGQPVELDASARRQLLLRPYLGRHFADSSRAEILNRCSKGNDFQMAIGDGLSVPAVAAQVPALLPLLYQSAIQRGWTVGQAFVVRYCRVGILNEIGELLAPRVAVLLIGERPGLASADSLSAYMAYRPDSTHTDANRNLISNIHARGLSAEEAAGRILRLAELMIMARTSGYNLKIDEQNSTHSIARTEPNRALR